MSSPPDPDSAFRVELAKQLAITATNCAWSIAQGIGSYAWEKVKVAAAMARYTQSYRERHGDIKVLGMSQPVPLHQIYTGVRVLSPQHLHTFASLQELEKAFRASGRRHASHAIQQATDGITVANERQFLNILGVPGSGKSTFLRRLGQEAMLARIAEEAVLHKHELGTTYSHDKLPVLIELRRFRHEEIDLFRLISLEFEQCGFPNATGFAQGALDTGRLLILLDGLDEVPDERLDKAIAHVRAFVNTYGHADGNRFVTSCRTAHYKNFFSRFTDVVLADFDREQIRQFSQNWFSSYRDRTERTSERFFELLQRPQNAGALELAATPLMLTFLCITYSHRQELPPTRAALYRRALDILLREWSAEKRVHDEPAYQELNAELELDMLSQMGAALFEEDRFFFTRQEAIDQITHFMRAELNAPRSLDAHQILDAIEQQQGLIVQRAQGAYSFSHLTIQEYLTAKRLWDSGETKWRRYVTRNFLEHRWHVVIELMAGLGRVDELILLLAELTNQEWIKFVRLNHATEQVASWIDRHVSQQERYLLQPVENLVGRLTLLSLVFTPFNLGEYFDDDGDDGRFISDAILSLIDLAQSLLEHDLEGVSLEEFGGSVPSHAFDGYYFADALLRRELLNPDSAAHFEEIKAYFFKALNSKHYPGVGQIEAILDVPILLDSKPDVARQLDRFVSALRLLFECKNNSYSLTSEAWMIACSKVFGPSSQS